MKRVLKTLITAIAATFLVASNPVLSGTIDAGLAQAMESGGKVSFIVHFSDQLDLSAFPGRGKAKGIDRAAMIKALRSHARDTQATARGILRQKGAGRLIPLWSINAMAVTATSDVISELAALPEVSKVTLDATVPAPVAEAAASSAPEWNLDAIQVPALWNAGYDGTGTVIAGMDTGVDADHPELAASWRGGSNSWFDPNGEHPTPYDASGHGTQTMGLMVGGDLGGTAIGVAPGAQWIAVKIFNDAGYASISGIHQGFQWLLDPDDNPDTNDAPDIVNNSWGFPDLVGQCYLEFNADIQTLKNAGIAVVFSAGNQGSLGSESPADNPDAFAAGAVDASLALASSSSRGPSSCDGSVFPEVVAPGVNVKTSDLTFGGVIPNSYAYVTGTSFAAPHVSATMALLLQANPAASVSDIEQALTEGAVDLGIGGADNETGYGLIDAVASNDLLQDVTVPNCVDSDGDLYFSTTGCGTLLDCDDSDPGINPAACDIKRDGIDQNCDGSDRTGGKSCPVPDGGGDSGTTDGSEGKGNTCSDNIDNDNDGFLDCLDPDCSKNRVCKL